MSQRYWYRLEEAMRFAQAMGRLSTCKRLAVGCLLVTPKLERILAVGYNGPPTGLANSSCTNEPGECGCVHAEANALVKSDGSPGILITTYSPCRHCAGMVINSGLVKKVIYQTQFRDGLGLVRLLGAGIEVRKYSDEIPSEIRVDWRDPVTRPGEKDQEWSRAVVREWWRSSLARGVQNSFESQRRVFLLANHWDDSRAISVILEAFSDLPGATLAFFDLEFHERFKNKKAQDWLALGIEKTEVDNVVRLKLCA